MRWREFACGAGPSSGTRARVNIGRSSEIFSPVEHASSGHRYFVEKPDSWAGRLPRGPNGLGQRVEWSWRTSNANTTSHTRTRRRCGSDVARLDVPGLCRDVE